MKALVDLLEEYIIAIYKSLTAHVGGSVALYISHSFPDSEAPDCTYKCTTRTCTSLIPTMCLICWCTLYTYMYTIHAMYMHVRTCMHVHVQCTCMPVMFGVIYM